MKGLTTKPVGIEEFQKYINNLYGEANNKRSLEYLYSYLFRNAAYLSRVIGEKGESKVNFIKTFSWLFSITSKLNIDLENSFRHKYPNICPYCLVKPCICIKTGKKPIAYIPEWKASEEIEVKYNIDRTMTPQLSLDKAVETINDLYPANKHIWNAAGPTFQFYRILEELGEVHEAYTSYQRGDRKKENIEEELADVFAWLVSTWGICYPELSLADEFIGYYYEGCPVCTSTKCKCPDHNDRGERLVEIKQLTEFKNKIEELINIKPEYKESLGSVINSLDTVVETKSTAGAVRTVNQTKAILQDISKSLGAVDKSANSTNSIIKATLEMIKLFGWM